MYFYEEINIDDMEFEGNKLCYPCPCGDTFELAFEDFLNGSEVAECPTCSLTIKVLCNADQRSAFLSRHAVDQPIALVDVCA